MAIDPTIGRKEIKPIETSTKETKEKGPIKQEELGSLAKKGQPQKAVKQESSSPFVKTDTKNSSKSIKKAFTSFFDKSIPEDKDIKEKVDVKGKIKHEKEIKTFFKEYSPEVHVLKEKTINDPEYIKKTLDTMLGYIDEAAKQSTKADKQACLNKLIVLKDSDEFMEKLGTTCMQNMLAFASAYKNKVLK